MTKKITISLLVLLLVLTMVVGLVACKKDNELIDNRYPLGYDLSIPRMTGDVTSENLKLNPDRGFAIEASIKLDNIADNYKGTYAFPDVCSHAGHVDNGKPINTFTLINNELNKYAKYTPRVIELTVYLTDFIGTDLSDKAIYQLDSMLKSLDNMNVIVKFAYTHDNKPNVKPTVNDIKRHMDNIRKNWLDNLSSTVKYSLSAIRLSFIGDDGNFVDSGYSDEEIKELTNAFVAMIPDRSRYFMQVPNVDIKNNADDYSKLINMGFYNDNFDSTLNKYSSGSADMSSAAYQQYFDQSKFNYNSAGVIRNKKDIDGKAVLKLLKDGHFTTFNLSHMFSGSESEKNLLAVWASTIITEKDLKDNNLPYYEEWFLNADGTSSNRSVLDYLRDFLGYNLSVTNLKISKFTKNVNGNPTTHTSIKLTLTNFGMACPLHVDKFGMYIRNNITGKYITGKMLTYSAYDPQKLTSGGQIEFEQIVEGDIDIIPGATSQENKGFSIGIQLYEQQRRPAYVRLSNAVPYHNNVNWIYSTIGLDALDKEFKGNK